MDNHHQNISVIGIGRLGLAWALVLEKAGYNVIGCDINEDYVKSINDKTFKTIEPQINDYLNKAKNFVATIDLEFALSSSTMIFINVRTESHIDGRYDHSQLDNLVNAILDIGKQINKKHLVIATNVNPGYCDYLAKILEPLNYEISFNPEYVQQGKIINWDENPEIVVIGANSKKIGKELESVIRNVCKNKPPFFRMDRLSAEISKLALNCFLTIKISYANSIGDLAIKAGGDPEKILEAIGGDSRIGSKNLKYGFGYGGPCFPRDNKALLHFSSKIGVSTPLSEAADKINNDHFEFIVGDFINNNDINTEVIFDGIGNKKYLKKNNFLIFEGVAYKKGTSILDDSQQLNFAVRLAENGYKVIINDIDNIVSQLKDKYGSLFIYN
jgi:nucleotide sugar dehydrogenase